MKVEVERDALVSAINELAEWSRECVDIATYMLTDEEQEAYYEKADNISRIRQTLLDAVNAVDGGLR